MFLNRSNCKEEAEGFPRRKAKVLEGCPCRTESLAALTIHWAGRGSGFPKRVCFPKRQRTLDRSQEQSRTLRGYKWGPCIAAWVVPRHLDHGPGDGGEGTCLQVTQPAWEEGSNQERGWGQGGPGNRGPALLQGCLQGPQG